MLPARVEQQNIKVHYYPERTLLKFHRSDKFYRSLMGPVGSGKSTACCWEIMRRAMEQAPGPDGIRRTRWVVVRNTYRELEDTTVKTWLDWFPEEQTGPYSKADKAHRIKFGDVEFEVLFRALDRPEDVKKLLSLELTGAWVNEAREVPKSIIDTLGDRVGRFPSQRVGGPTWQGVFLDTNPPDDDSWLYKLAEVQRHEDQVLQNTWDFFKQPGGLVEIGGKFISNPLAENLQNLPKDYYVTRQAGKSLDHIRVYYCNQYGFVVDGKAIYPEYADAIHCSTHDLSPIRGLDIYVGLDFGLTPAAVFAQRMPNGRWIWFEEIVTENMGIVRFCDLLIPKLQGEYAGFNFHIFGDPSGVAKAQTDEKTVFQILEAKGIPAIPAPSNNPTLRREAVAQPLSRLIDGKPGLIISPRMKTVRKGMAGGYCYKRIQVKGDERYRDQPDKNKYSHVCEAGQYAMLGAGEGQSLLTPGSGEQARGGYVPDRT